MSKFKAGDLAWSPTDGFAVLNEGEDENYNEVMHGGDHYHACGRLGYSDKHPTLLTVEEAAKLGYFPEKPKVKKTMYQVIERTPPGAKIGREGMWISSRLVYSVEEAKRIYGDSFIALGPAIEFEVNE